MKPTATIHAVLFAACLAMSSPGRAAVAAGPAAPAFDAEAAWARFLADGQLGRSFAAYAVLGTLGYPDIDLQRCEGAADALAQSLAQVPVSLALHHAALGCAQARGDGDEADRQAAALAALSRHALAAASGFGDPRPITLLAPLDARAMVLLAGYEPIYEYYQLLSPGRYFPLVIAALDAKAGTERHFVFDFVDIASRVDHESPYAGYPVNRQAFVNALVEQQAAGGDQAGLDLQAALAAKEISEPRKKVDRLRVVAAGGGRLATNAWIAVCTLHPYEGCADGLVDALLPLAEKRFAVPMVQLAYAYDQGIGIAVDPAAADALLAAAERRWPGGFAAVQFAHQWVALHDGPPTERILAILRRAEAGGNADATLLRVRELQFGKDDPALAAEDLARLAAPAINSVGAGEQELAYYYGTRGDERQAATWTTRAALHGDPDAQADESWKLLYGPEADRDETRGLAMLEAAAQGGSAYAGRQLAIRSRSAGDWKAAEGWLLAGAREGDVRSIMQLASIYETDHPGVPGKPELSIKTYEAFAAGDDQGAAAEARRRLAAMILEGQGMPRDVGKAKALLLQDAEKGNVDSQWMLGIGLFHGRFDTVDIAAGLEWLAKAEKAGSRQARNSLAWYQCTSRNPEVADRAAGAARAAELDAAGTHPDPAELDTLASCRAAVGDFADAMRLQQRAIDAIGTMGDLAVDSAAATSLKEYRERLALYRAGKPYVAEVDE